MEYDTECNRMAKIIMSIAEDYGYQPEDTVDDILDTIIRLQERDKGKYED